MSSNFGFLANDFPMLEKLGNAAENYLYSDADACLYKLGKIGETIINEMIRLDSITIPDFCRSHFERIKLLKKEGFLSNDVTDLLDALRKARNKTAHANDDSYANCEVLLRMAHTLCVWLMQTYGDWSYEPDDFVLPVKQPDYKEIIEKLEAELEKLAKEPPKESASTVSRNDRAKQASTAAGNMKRSEAETRYLIDQQLRKVGWDADTINLRYSKGTRPQKGRNIAIAEWPTDSTVGKSGYADYALFVGLQLVAIVEAKAEHNDVFSVIDYQCKDYPKCIRKEHDEFVISTWGDYKVPFTFATNGRPYLKQLETKSGIWFLDLRAPDNVPKALQGWMSPDGLIELLEKDIETANKKLGETPYDLLEDKDGLNLRKYQIKAIEAAENAIKNSSRTALLAMATGTGKTRTIIGLIYRLLKSDRFKRVLFLVDRNALGEQAEDVFKEVKIEDLMTLDNIYNIKNLEDKDVDKETRIQVATVQSMVKRILYNESDVMPSVTDYDLIVVDEAHRGYILDREMSEDELLYRDQTDYVSKYRTVIEYFDAVKIALTATPALHTSEIFGKPVFNYTYREAVIEGHLVDHDAPHNIVTELSQNGIVYEKGEKVPIYDPVTGEITNSDELEDELKFDVDTFNRRVITEPFNRTVLEEIAQDIDPEEPEQGKTLIYAVDDQHADLIVKILKEIYGERGVDNDAIRKITGKVGGGDRKKVLEVIKRFKNEKYPSIAVTVDLLTTGIDVPEITTLVFMRRIRSRILFEQMMGRATRLCPKIEKTHFEIYDAVGVYESLSDVNTMKPVVANPSTSFDDLLDGLEKLPTEEQVKCQLDLIIAKLQRKKRNMSEKTAAHFIDLSGGLDPAQFMQSIREMTPEDARAHLLHNRKLFELFNEGGLKPNRMVVISDKEDKLISHTRDYGKGQRPEDYLGQFEAFIKTNLNEIAALNIVCTRPKELTRESLKSLCLALDREGFTEQQLNTAWKDAKNEEITADIISFIRRHAIGSTLLSHEQRIHNAVETLVKNHTFSKQETNWIKRMEKYLLNESILNVQTFNEGAFKDSGGFDKINKAFSGQLESIVLELNDYLYDDGGHTA